MDDSSILPPMPESDSESVQRNKYHQFYKVGAKDFWKDAAVTHHTVEEFKKCQHYFIRQGYEIACEVCHMGWQAPATVQAKDGQLYIDGNHVEL